MPRRFQPCSLLLRGLYQSQEFLQQGAVIGTDVARARRVASQLRAGRVVINNMTDDAQAPWGGFKYSGVGREYGRYGIEAFLETKAILES
jgi:aldehyde dehydrogenase (NAD+)